MQSYHQVNPLPIYDLGHTAYHAVGASEEKWTLSRFVKAVQPAIILGAAFHGYRRNQSIPWAIGWVVAARIAPVVTAGVAVAQGFGQPKRKDV